MSLQGRLRNWFAGFGDRLVKTGSDLGGSPYFIPEVKQFYDAVAGRYQMYFDGASRDRLHNDWSTTGGTPYSNLSGDLKTLIHRSRRSTDNQALSKQIDTTFLSNVIYTGIKPEPMVRDERGDLMDEVNEVLRAGWERVNDQWDRTGHGTYYEAQKLQFKTIINSGSCLVNTVPSPRGSYLPVAWEIVEPDRLDWARDTYHGVSKRSDSQRSTMTQYGIDFDRYGRPVQYWVEGVNAPFPAEVMDIRYLRDRPSQFIGVPWKAPVLNALWDIDNLVEDKTVQSRIHSLIGFWFNQADAAMLTKKVNSGRNITMEPGKHLYSRHKPEVIEPKGNLGETFDPLVRLIQRTIAIGSGLSYQILTKDLQGMNFASSRANILEDRRLFRIMQAWAIKSSFQRDWDRYVQWSFLSGKLAPLTYGDYLDDPWRWNQSYWQPPGWDWVDPLKDARAAIELHKRGMLTLKEHFGSRGRNWKAEIDQYADELAYIQQVEAEKGVAIFPVAPDTAPNGPDDPDEVQNAIDDLIGGQR